MKAGDVANVVIPVLMMAALLGAGATLVVAAVMRDSALEKEKADEIERFESSGCARKVFDMDRNRVCAWECQDGTKRCDYPCCGGVK